MFREGRDSVYQNDDSLCVYVYFVYHNICQQFHAGFGTHLIHCVSGCWWLTSLQGNGESIDWGQVTLDTAASLPEGNK